MVNGFLRGFYGTEASALRCGLYCLLAVWFAHTDHDGWAVFCAAMSVGWCIYLATLKTRSV